MSIGKRLCVLMLSLVGTAAVGCASPPPPPPVAAAWPDYVCTSPPPKTARAYLNEIDALAFAAYGGGSGPLSLVYYEIIVLDTAQCRNPIMFPYYGTDADHCYHVKRAWKFAGMNNWVECARELELGHM